ncbi:MAG: cell wall hydrolase, partial [Erythrobacter sp.]|nr:cell wall hydrolase [Erythrobacter sp.]
MSRKTASMIALAAVATATITLPGVDGAAVLAQSAQAEANDQLTPSGAAELVPETPVFISQEVVQPLPEPAPAPVLTEAGSLRELVGMVDTAAPLSEEMRCLAG